MKRNENTTNYNATYIIAAFRFANNTVFVFVLLHFSPARSYNWAGDIDKTIFT